MKATGIVRRIDDLGRVVVPKEIRRTLRIREGDPLEIFTDKDGEIILKKYSPIGELGTFAKQYAEALAQTGPTDGRRRDGVSAQRPAERLREQSGDQCVLQQGGRADDAGSVDVHRDDAQQ